MYVNTFKGILNIYQVLVYRIFRLHLRGMANACTLMIPMPLTTSESATRQTTLAHVVHDTRERL